MKSIILSIVALLALVFVCLTIVEVANAGPFRQRVTTRVVRTPAVAPVTQRPREERVIELPEDGHLWNFTLVADDGTLSQYVENAPRLTALKDQTKFRQFNAAHWWAKQHFPGDRRPLVLVQTDNGEVIYKASGDNMPRQAEELADEVESSIQSWAANCGPNCPTPSKTRPATKIPDLRPKDGDAWSVNLEQAIAIGGLAVIALLALRQFLPARA